MNTKATSIYATFVRQTCEYAIDASFIQQIIQSPATLMPPPIGCKGITGYFQFRNSLCALVEIDRFLDAGLPSISQEGAHLMVCLVENQYFAIPIDSTGRLFRFDAYSYTDLKHNPHDDRRVIDGVFTTSSSEELIQRINIQKLILGFSAQLFVASNDAKASHRYLKDPAKRFAQFRIGHLSAAIRMDSIREIIPGEDLQRNSEASSLYLGHIDKKGWILPVINFRTFLNLDSSNAEPHSGSIIVIHYEENLLGLKVDGMEDIIVTYGDDLMEVNNLAHNDLVGHCVRKSDQSLVPVYNVSSLLKEKRLAACATKSLNESLHTKKSKERNLKTMYLTFRLKGLCGIKTSDLSEIIELPTTLLPIPGYSKAMLGLHNLRGKLIPIIDGRKLYEIEAQNEGTKRVMIIKTESTIVGLVIDKLESLVLVQADEVFPAAIVTDPDNVSLSHDAVERIMTQHQAHNQHCIVLGADKLCDRIFQGTFKRVS